MRNYFLRRRGLLCYLWLLSYGGENTLHNESTLESTASICYYLSLWEIWWIVVFFRLRISLIKKWINWFINPFLLICCRFLHLGWLLGFCWRLLAMVIWFNFVFFFFFQCRCTTAHFPFMPIYNYNLRRLIFIILHTDEQNLQKQLTSFEILHENTHEH